jgi:hypothetical protein
MDVSAPTARVAGLLAAAAMTVAGLCAPPAFAQDATVPTHSAVAGEPFSVAGTSAEIVDATCSNLRDVSINWRDGSPRTPVTGSLVEAAIPNPVGEPLPALRVAVPATEHVFPDVSQPVLVEVTVSYWVTCIAPGGDPSDPFDGEPYEFNGDDQALFSVLIRPANTSRPTSCPSPFTGITASARPLALAAQQACEEPKKRFTRRQKLALRYGTRFCYSQAALDAFFAYALAADPDPLVSKALVPFLAGRGIALGFCAGVLADLYNDPPDPKYRSVAQPSRIRLPRVVSRGARAAVINRYLVALARSASLYKALVTAIERAQGATVAKSKRFEKRQMLAAANYASRLADVLDDLTSDSKTAARALTSVAGKATVTEQAVAGAKEGLAAEGLPDAIERQIGKLGELGGFVREALLARIAETPAAALAGKVPRVAAGSAATRKAYRRVAETLHSFARQTRRAPLASR